MRQIQQPPQKKLAYSSKYSSRRKNKKGASSKLAAKVSIQRKRGFNKTKPLQGAVTIIPEKCNTHEVIKLNANDIKKGMRVKSEQLSEIFDTYIILSDVKLVRNKIGIGTLEGVISDISDKPIRVTQEKSVLIYHDSYERWENCEYE